LIWKEVQITSARNLWVVIPAFNEGPVIGEVVRGVHAVYRNVVVVDDCSRDDTGSAAQAAGAVRLRHPINLGQGAALQTGISYALIRGADYIITFDADGQHRVEDIAVLLDTQARTNADVVVGSRFLGRVENIPALRRIVLKLAVLFTRLSSGAKLTDAHNGLRLFTRRAAERIRITHNRMAHASEVTYQIHRLGLSVAEAPVTVVYTEYSLGKGQKLSNAFNIVAELIIGRISK
jgi:glycosyltransferase involved in cell wall biosynthesis